MSAATLAALLTGIAGIISAVTGLVIALRSSGKASDALDAANSVSSRLSAHTFAMHGAEHATRDKLASADDASENGRQT